MTNEEVGKELLYQRKIQGLTQRQYAEQLGLTRAQYVGYERGNPEKVIVDKSYFAEFNKIMNQPGIEHEGVIGFNPEQAGYVQRVLREIKGE